MKGTLTFNRQTRLPERFGRMPSEDHRDVNGRKVPFLITDGLAEWRVRDFATSPLTARKNRARSGPS